MGIPLLQKTRIGTYLARQKMAGRDRFPLVLMLEPTFRCNLHCRGCGKIDYPQEILGRQLSVKECLEAVDECGAPVVSIPGGEPLMHPEIATIVQELVARKKIVYICTNGLLLEKRLDEFRPSPYLNFSIHLDGMRDRHDAIVWSQGVFDRAVSAIRMLRSYGFRVTTNTTLYAGESPENVADFFDFLSRLGVEGMMVAPGFSFEEDDGEGFFLSREHARALLRKILEIGRGRWRFNHSPAYLQFLAGELELTCSPWGNPTRNIFGWQKPCYLLNDGYVGSFRELMDSTDWDRYGTGRDSRCADCLVHCGFEPSAVTHSLGHPWQYLKDGLVYRPPDRKGGDIAGEKVFPT